MSIDKTSLTEVQKRFNALNFRSRKRLEGEENFVGDSEIIALGGASNETKDRPLG